MMGSSLKEEFLRLLEEDVEFRYAVAGYLGLLEVLKRLDRHEEAHTKLLEEIRALRGDQLKLWEEVRALREEVRGLWEEVRDLRKDQELLWKEVRELRENTRRLWSEVQELSRNQEKLWEEVKALREDTRRLWEEVRELRKGQEKLWRYMRTGFRELSRALGASLEDYARAFIELLLGEMGYPEALVERKVFIRDGELVEVNVFCEDPLIVGEATTAVGSVEEAEKEVEKVLERARLVEEKLGRRPMMIFLAVANAPSDAAEALKRLAREKGIRLILGKELEEYF